MIILPWPHRYLSPNARLHFRAKAAAVKSYRESAYWLTVAAAVETPSFGPIPLRIEFHPPDNRRRDLDNMLASIKAGLDGVADAILVNDQRFELHLFRRDPVKGGRVIISIATAEAKPIGELVAPIIADITDSMKSEAA